MGHVSQACLVINLPMYGLLAKTKIYVYCGFYFSSNPIRICEAEVQCVLYTVLSGEDKRKEREADSSIL